MSDTEFLRYIKDKDAIEKLIFSYATALDERQFSLLAPIATDNLHFNYGGVFKGDTPDAWVDMIKSNLGGCGPSQHLFSNIRINTNYSTSIDSARAVFYGRVVHAGKADEREILFDFWGEYQCKLLRVATDTHGGWRFCEVVQVPFHFTGDMKILKSE
tara:strand:+ start:271 stop:744 length:474 start_codon:yes stop_codon:yes gene_type:complete